MEGHIAFKRSSFLEHKDKIGGSSDPILRDDGIKTTQGTVTTVDQVTWSLVLPIGYTST